MLTTKSTKPAGMAADTTAARKDPLQRLTVRSARYVAVVGRHAAAGVMALVCFAVVTLLWSHPAGAVYVETPPQPASKPSRPHRQPKPKPKPPKPKPKPPKPQSRPKPREDAFKIQKYIVSAGYKHEETFSWRGREDQGPPCNVGTSWTHNGSFQEEWVRARIRAVVRDTSAFDRKPPEVGIGPGVQPFPLGVFAGGDEDHIRTTYTVTASGGGERRVTRPRTGIPECDHETEDRSSKAPTEGCGKFQGKGQLGVSLKREPGKRKGEPDSVRFSFGLLEPDEQGWGGYPPGFNPLHDPERSYCPGHRRAERGLKEKAMYARMPVREMAAKPRPWSASRYQTYTIMAKDYAPDPDAALRPVKVESGWFVSFVPVKASRKQCIAELAEARALRGALRDLTEKEVEEAVQECVQGGGLSEVWDTDNGWADEP